MTALIVGAGSWALAANLGGDDGGADGTGRQAAVAALTDSTGETSAHRSDGPAASGAPTPPTSPAAAEEGAEEPGPPAQNPPPPPNDGLISTPNVVGMSLDSAAATLKGAGFSSIPYEYGCHGSSNIGGVVRQNPGPGSRVAATTPVQLALQADNCSTVPDVRGMSLGDASYTLQQIGFTNIPYVYECLGSPQVGAVISQSPGPGTSYGRSQPVNLRLQANNC